MRPFCHVCQRVLANIPDGSAVVFMFGEIDCREGILVAVEKLRYDTVQEGMDTTAGIFIKVNSQKTADSVLFFFRRARRFCANSLFSIDLNNQHALRRLVSPRREQSKPEVLLFVALTLKGGDGWGVGGKLCRTGGHLYLLGWSMNHQNGKRYVRRVSTRRRLNHSVTVLSTVN